MTTHRPRRRATWLAWLLPLAVGTACADQATAPDGQDPPAPTADAPDWRLAALDSLFGDAAAPIAEAIAERERALDARATAWVDSITASLEAPPAAASAARAAAPGVRAARAGRADPPRLALEDRVELRLDGTPYTIDLGRTFDLEVGDDEVTLHERSEEVVVNLALAYGEPMQGRGNSYRTIMDSRATVASCPDASGVSAGRWEGMRDLYTTFDSPSLADADNWRYKLRQAATATIEANVNAEAQVGSFDYDLSYEVLHKPAGLPMRDGSARVRRSGVAPGALFAPLPPGDVGATEGDYAFLSHLGGSVHTLHMHFGFGSSVAYAEARALWRGGRCVEVQEPGGAVQPASPNAQMTLRPFVVHRHDGSRPAAPIEAHAEGGAVTPTGTPVAHPASFAYTATATGAGAVRFRTVSNRGIGHGEVRFTPLEQGSMLSYTSRTSYEIRSRQDYSDELISGIVTGNQQLTSRLTLVPHEPMEDGDLAAFAVVAETDIVVDASAAVTSRGYDGGSYTGDMQLRIDGSGTVRNPAGAGDAEYDGFAPERYPASRDTAGVLRLFKVGGRHVYALDVALGQIVPELSGTGDRTHQCRDPDVAARSVARTTYDNGSLRHETVDTDPGDCWPDIGGGHTRDRPYAFGAIGVLRTEVHPVAGTTAMFIGTYEPASGVIEGQETVTIRTCDVVRGHDPLQLASVLNMVRVWREDLDYTQGSCTLEYTLRWRFFVPAA